MWDCEMSLHTKINVHILCFEIKHNLIFYFVTLEVHLDMTGHIYNWCAQWEKVGNLGSSFPGNLTVDHLEGNYDFSHKEIHKKWWEICLKCNYLPGKFTFCPALMMCLNLYTLQICICNEQVGLTHPVSDTISECTLQSTL